MFATLNRRCFATWFLYPAAAVAASLAAVIFWTILLGIAFLPAEARRLLGPHYVTSVTHCLNFGSGRSAVSLYWSIAETGKTGWQHHLAIHSAGARQRSTIFPWPDLKPQSVASGADPDHILVGNWDGAIYSLNIASPSEEPLCIGRQSTGGVIALAASSDGRCVISQSGFDLFGWDTTTHRQRWQRSGVGAYCFAIRGDSRTAILATTDGELIEIDLADGHTLRTLGLSNGPILSISLNADESALAVLRADGNLLLLDGHTAAPLWNARFQSTCLSASGRFAVFSPCGKMLVTASQDCGTTLAVWDVATGQRLRDLRGHQNVIHGAAFASRTELRSWGADGTIRTWDLETGLIQHVTTLGPPSKAT